MDTILRAAAIYFTLFVIFRAGGKRTLAQITTFDFVLILILGEATQQALIGDDFSITTAALLIVTLVGLELLLSRLQHKSQFIDRLIEGAPLVLVEEGRQLDDRMRRCHVGAADILAAAREKHGLENFAQIKYAVLECNGGISIVPRR